MEEQRLRAVLAAAVPQGASPSVLREHFYQKEMALNMIGDSVQREAVFRDAVKLLPDGIYI